MSAGNPYFLNLNNLEVVTTTSDKNADCFGFTEEEISRALDEFSLSGQKQQVKDWYDGFCLGKRKIFIILGPLSISWIKEKRVHTGQIPAPTVLWGSW